MPYATGETPEVGDYVKNQWEQPGRVTRVHFAQDEEDLICIRWDDEGLNFYFLLPLRDHSKPASQGHFKTGQR